ncbi:MAG: hypothetical protein B7Z81_13920, partial [Acidocella sp. 20-61-6]
SQNQTGAKVYRIRSCFWFSSINVGIEHQADDSRITVLALRSAPTIPSKEDADRFEQLNADVQSTITPAFSAGLLARSTKLLPVIRANAETFARAVAVHLGSRRLGDQLGTLLAGAYSLHSERDISQDQADDYIKRLDWRRDGAGDEIERDEIKLLTFLTSHRIRVTPGNAAPVEMTIGRLIAAAWGGDERMARDQAEVELRSRGMRSDEAAGLFVSNTHPAIKAILTGTQWSSGWQRSLLRLTGAEASSKAIRFESMHVAKAVYLPRATLEGRQ